MEAHVDGTDLISLLPDDILLAIITLLPTDDAARAAALARRWRHLWRSAPLNFDGGCIRGSYLKKMEYIGKILSNHPGPALRFRIRSYYPGEVDGWLRSPALRGLQEIDVWIHDHRLLSACPVLETLLLEYCAGLSHLVINSHSLTSFGLCVDDVKELVIEDAPHLERLIRFGWYSDQPIIQITNAPKLKFLGVLTDFVKTTVSQENMFAAGNPAALMRDVKSLQLRSIDLQGIVDFLKLFPCMEKLYIPSFQRMDMENVHFLDPQGPADYLGHLREVYLNSYTGEELDVHLARFFVRNAQVLEVMKIGVSVRFTEEWTAQQRHMIFDRRPSPNARVDFVNDCNGNIYSCKNFIRDHTLSLADPFGSSCGYCG